MPPFSHNRVGRPADSFCAAAGVGHARRNDNPWLRPGQVDSRTYFERSAVTIATLSREELKNQIKGFQGAPKLDFTDDYLDRISLDRLRHILLAVVLTCRPNG